jgi:phosphoribosylformylglycinamidine synthase
VTASVGVVVFPGTNCEYDTADALRLLGAEPVMLWHHDAAVGAVDAIVVPGGFAHGDYLRPGAIARFSPVMRAVADFADAGGPVVGICNGFQVLTEAGLLPGALQKNSGLKFVCAPAALRVESTNSVLTSGAAVGSVLNVPINHLEGNYTCSPETLAELPLQDAVSSLAATVACPCRGRQGPACTGGADAAAALLLCRPGRAAAAASAAGGAAGSPGRPRGSP